MRCFHNTFTDIYFHLAAEEYLLKQETDSVFMLWQDTPSVVMGKHQSVQLEVNREWAEEQQIQIARRFSGGGAVYHDLGNVNLTFIETVSRLPDFSLYLHRILDFLKQIESDNELKKQFIKFKNTYALLSFSDAACGKKTTRDSYTQFLCKMRAKHIRQISFYLFFKYAAIITLLIIFAYQAGVNQHSEILQENIENKLHVPAGQRIKLTLQDGTTVWLNSHTTLTYPAIFDKKERRVAIDGEAFFIVAQDKHKPFIVSSQGIETKVLGTQFNICSYRKNNDVRTSLIEGSLQIYFTGKENESIILSPNEQISIKNGTIKVDTISHHDYFLWKEGIYSFKDELLVDILNKLQLYYDVRIIIRNPSINQEKYTGKFRQRDSIDDILRMLQKIHKFKIQKDEENNIITLS